MRNVHLSDHPLMIAPLSLSNVLTVLVALLCLWTMSPQARGGVVRIWRMAIPGCFAAVQALVLLAGVFDATIIHDAEWLAALIVGSVVGRMRGWAMHVDVDQMWGLVRLPQTIDGRIAAAALVALSAIDFTSAMLEDPVIEPQHGGGGRLVPVTSLPSAADRTACVRRTRTGNTTPDRACGSDQMNRPRFIDRKRHGPGA